MSEPIVEMHAIFSGTVQGVGFRATVYHYANQVGLKGTVRNLPDGTVEVIAQGTQHHLDQFLAYMQRNETLIKVESVKHKFYPPQRIHKDFSITR